MNARDAAEAQKENAPPTACWDGAAVSDRRLARTTVCLVSIERFRSLSGHEQASYFNFWRVGGSRNTALEMARIYFPQ